MRPILEYCSPVWDPYSIMKYTSNIEKVQRRAARFVFNRYHNMSSPTDMIRQLEWESLEQRRRKARLTMFYKIQHGLVAVPLPQPLWHGHWDQDQDTPTNTKQTTTGPIHTKTVFFPTCNKAVEHTSIIHRFWGHPTSFPGCPLISLLLTTIFYLCF